MFERFLRHLLIHDVCVATFDAGHLEFFLSEVDRNSAPGTTTRLRHAKLVDRLCRHLVQISLRQVSPAADFTRSEAWPVDGPTALFLDPESDQRLQAFVAPGPDDDVRTKRMRAIVALLPGTGITATEIRGALLSELDTAPTRPHSFVPKRGARDAR